MPLGLSRRPLAEQDLDEIWLYIALDDAKAADRLVDRIDEAERRLAVFPQLGQERSEIWPGLRHWPVGDYLILYLFDEEHLEVLRIVHGARDLPGLFADEEPRS